MNRKTPPNLRISNSKTLHDQGSVSGKSTREEGKGKRSAPPWGWITETGGEGKGRDEGEKGRFQGRRVQFNRTTFVNRSRKVSHFSVQTRQDQRLRNAKQRKDAVVVFVVVVVFVYSTYAISRASKPRSCCLQNSPQTEDLVIPWESS